MSAPISNEELQQLDNLFARGVSQLTPNERQRAYELWVILLAGYDKSQRTIGGLNARIRHLDAQLKDRQADLTPDTAVPTACCTPSVCHAPIDDTTDMIDDEMRTS